jgi:hypothetical protein
MYVIDVVNGRRPSNERNELRSSGIESIVKEENSICEMNFFRWIQRVRRLRTLDDFRRSPQLAGWMNRGINSFTLTPLMNGDEFLIVLGIGLDWDSGTVRYQIWQTKLTLNLQLAQLRPWKAFQPMDNTSSCIISALVSVIERLGRVGEVTQPKCGFSKWSPTIASSTPFQSSHVIPLIAWTMQ